MKQNVPGKKRAATTYNLGKVRGGYGIEVSLLPTGKEKNALWTIWEKFRGAKPWGYSAKITLS